MNDPNKVISVNLSSLLSLKAELMRKQTEVEKAKLTQSTGEEYTAKKSKKTFKKSENYTNDVKRNHKGGKETTKDVFIEEHEDTLALAKSQKILQAKAKYYERMSKSGGHLNSDDNCLVMFNKKRQEEQQIEEENIKCTLSNSSEDDENNPLNISDDEWVEYVDCLGRTRKCLQADLEDAKKRDAELAASMPERLDQSKANWMIDTLGNRSGKREDDSSSVIGPCPTQSVYGDGLSMMSKHEEQKVSWERKELENLEKKDVHYQDVFFDEARQHGVGYYAFSTDEEERRRQQKELGKARQHTLEEQKKREALRIQRERIITERVFAAKNRQRMRLGLPPLNRDEELNNTTKDETSKESKEERKSSKKLEKLEKQRKAEEEERERERQNHIRPWDINKASIYRKQNLTDDEEEEDEEEEKEWKYRPEREPMSQEQWNELKRNERPMEFAPPPEKVLKRTNFNVIPEHRTIDNDAVPLYSHNSEAFKNYQNSSCSSIKNTFKRPNTDSRVVRDDLRSDSSHRGVCIPPPQSLITDTSHSHPRMPRATKDLEKSIEAGLRFLRNNCDKNTSATKSSWTSKVDY